MNLKKYIILLLFGIGGITAKSQDIIEYGIISSSDFPDTLYHYSVTNFTAYDMYLYLELKQRDLFTKLFPYLIDSSLIAYKDKSLTQTYTYTDLRKGFRTAQDTNRYYDSATNTIHQYISYPSNIYFAKSLILNLPLSIGFELYSKNIIYLRFTDINKYLSREEITFLHYLNHKKQAISNTETIISFAKHEVHTLALMLYNIGIKGKATMYWNHFDTNTYTLNSIKERINPYWSHYDTITTGEKVVIKERKEVAKLNTDSLKYIRLYSKWEETKQLGYSVEIDFLAPTSTIVVASLHLPNIPLFLLTTGEVLPLFTNEEKDFYSYCFRFNLSNRMTNKNHQEETEYSREYPPEGYEAEY